MHFLVIYEYTDDYLERREPHRAAHLAYAWAAQERGELFLGGAITEPPCGAVIIFDCDGPEVAEEFVRHDPYVINNVVKSWQIRPWTTVVGEHAKNPVRP